MLPQRGDHSIFNHCMCSCPQIRKFRYRTLRGKIGSFFTVSSPDHNGKSKQVVQIVRLYETDDKEDEHRAVVKWFVDCASLSMNIANYKSIKHKLKSAAEIILDDTKNADANIISIKKLQERCYVIFGRTDEEPDLPQKRHPVYFCRYKVTEQYGRLKLEPYFSDDEDSFMSDEKLNMEPIVRLKRIDPSLPCSPRISRYDRGTRLCGEKSVNGKQILVKKAAVPNGEGICITDSESESQCESENTKDPVCKLPKLPNVKLTDEEIVSLLTADDIDSDENIFSEFEDEAPDYNSDQTQSSRKPNDVNHIQRKLVLHSSGDNNSMGKQRRPRNISSSDDCDERYRIKRPKLDLVTTPTSSPKHINKPQLPQKDESTLPLSEVQMSRGSSKSRPYGLKMEQSEAKTSFVTPKKNSGLQRMSGDSPAIQRTSETRIMRTPSKSRRDELEDDALFEPKASSITPKKGLGLQKKSVDRPADQRIYETQMMRTSSTKSRPGQLKYDELSESEVSSRTPKRTSSTKGRPGQLKDYALSELEASSRTPKRTSSTKSRPGQLKDYALSESEEASSRTPKRTSSTKSRLGQLKDYVLSELEASSRTPKRTSSTKSRPGQLKDYALSESEASSRRPKRTSSTKSKPGQLKDYALSESEASSRTPKKKLISALQSVSSDSPVQISGIRRTPRKAGSTLLRSFDKTVIVQDSTNDTPRRSSPRTPVLNKRYADGYIVDIIKSQMEKATVGEKTDEHRQPKSITRVQQLSSATPSPRNKRAVEEQEDSRVHKLSKQAQQTPSNSSSARTPKSKKGSSVRRTLLTPSMPSRSHSVESPSSILEIVRSRLCVSTVPKSLPCREHEFYNIYHFLEGKIIDRASGCMYVSGVPGTGKTATVQEVVRRLKSKADRNEIPSFDLVELNGMRMTEPKQAYVQLYKALTGQALVADQAVQLLEKRFSTSKRKQNPTIVIVDELDMLCTRRQDVVYHLLDWPTKSSSQLVVVTIANTMDLPEKLLKGRVTSRLGLTRVTFQPYTFQQLKIIVMERLRGLDVFDHDAVELVSRKVAAVSGDARRALDICRRATELAEGKADLVGMQHVDEAVQEMSTSATVRMIKNCSTLEQNFLKAVLAKMQSSGLDEASFRTVYDQMLTICTFDGIKVPSVTEALQICAALGSARLLIVKHSRYDIHQDILLNVSCDDLHYALQVAAA